MSAVPTLDIPPALSSSLQLVLDLAGTFVFALSGGMAGVKRRLDLFGVLVLAFARSHRQLTPPSAAVRAGATY